MYTLAHMPYDILVMICSYLSPFDRICISKTCKSMYSYRLDQSMMNNRIILSGLSTSHIVTDRFFARLIDTMTQRQRDYVELIDFEFASQITVHSVMMALTTFPNLRTLNCRYCRNIKLPDLSSSLQTSVVQPKHLEKLYLGDWKMPMSREWDDAWIAIDKRLKAITQTSMVVETSDCLRCHVRETPLSRACCQCKQRIWHCQKPACYVWWSTQQCPTCNVLLCHDCRFKNTQRGTCTCEDVDLEQRDECRITSCVRHGHRESHISARPGMYCLQSSG